MPPREAHVVLLRVGIDKGLGGILGPIFADGSFEFLPIPDTWGPDDSGIDERTYGNTRGRTRKPLLAYFPESRRSRMADCSLHLDPEFETFTYGDPTKLKASLARLQEGDLLVFYAGLSVRGFDSPDALYIVGYFDVARAGTAVSFSASELESLFGRNFHVRHRSVFKEQKDRLVLVKGGHGSRLLERAVRISSPGKNRGGRRLHRLSTAMQGVFGDFNGKTSIQRSPPRWVLPEFREGAASYVRELR